MHVWNELMKKLSKTLIMPLWLTACLIVVSTAFAQEPELSEQLIASRLTELRSSGIDATDEKVKAYEAAQSWLRRAASHDRDAFNYVDAITTAPQREAQIRQRIEKSELRESPTISFSGLSLQELGEQIRLTRAELLEAEKARDRIDQRLANREANASLSHSRLENIIDRLSELTDLNVLVAPQATPSLDEGLLWSAVAEQIALSAEQRAQQARLASQPVRYSALRAERAELAIQIENLMRKERNLELVSRNKLPNTTDSQNFRIESNSPVYTIAQQLTTSNTDLREQQLLLETRLDDITANQDEVERLIVAFAARFATARRVVDFASDSDILGKVLLAHWEELQGNKLSVSIKNIPQQAGNTVINRIAHEEALTDLVNSSRYISRQIDGAGLEATNIPEHEWDMLIELARTQHELLRRLIALESTYIDVLGEFEADHTRLTELMYDYETYLGTLILWIPSRSPLWETDPTDIPIEFNRLKKDLGKLHPAVHPSIFITLLIGGLLLLARPRLKEWQFKQHRQPLWLQENSLRFTFLALVATILRAFPIPLLLLTAGLLFSHQTVPITVVLTDTINGISVVLFALILMRILCEGSGVAKKHFGWKPYTCRLLNNRMHWLILWWLPITALASFLFMLDYGTVLMGRLTLLFSLFFLATSVFREVRRDSRTIGRQRLSTNQNYVRVLLICILVLLIGGIVWGLRYSVIIIATRLVLSLCVSVGLVLCHNIILSWLRGMERRIRLTVKDELGADESGIDGEEQAMLAEISVDTTRLLNAVTLTATLLALYYIWTPLFPVLDALARVSLWHYATMVDGVSVTTQITLETLVVVIFLVSVTIYAARKLPALVELTLHSRTRVSSGSRFAVSTLLSYVIVGAGSFAALSALGLKWSQLQWLIAALSIGIGFGLQEIIANFISGVIILFERPIRVGDFISVGSVDGVVTKIRIRAATIQDRDGKELVVPNKEFVTGQLLNWTLSNQYVRITVPVGIAYGSDVEAALKILREVASDNSKVTENPKPLVIFENFGDNTLDLTLRCFSDHVEELWSIISELNLHIYERFSKAGIVIAFPQRDIHFDPEQPLRIQIDGSPRI
jgi:potassium efflux system protein